MNPISILDTLTLSALYAMRDAHWVLVNIWISEFGRAATVTLLGSAFVLGLLLWRHTALAQGMFLTLATSGLAVFFLKGFIARERPAQMYWAYHETWYSFPSAHATLAMALYGFSLYVVFCLTRSRLVRFLALLLMPVLILAVGFSRLYLGVHYPSDVLVGFLLGGMCVWLGVWITRLRSVTPL